MNIRQLEAREELPLDLLLEADPSEQLVRSYCADGYCFVAEKQEAVIGVFVLIALDSATAEIKNIALAEPERGKGHGKRLVLVALEEARKLGFTAVEIGTGNSSLAQLALYQKCGFRMKTIDRDFFTRHYTEPIFENGLECRDMVRLDYRL
ncbi:GNAT family N-acetyltransferase [Planococcus maritimus]|uniref:GNAT family N-acetyltransferase n=1 Tax=Planococcus maritimus TaxID=192421 RepID=UPI0007974FFE|nr:GNAT family N-acetyltransferase [Planococcus maritimus]KYG57694.1 acetyltransferase [Planococcus maritimus]OED31448.1 GNAT family N-acetyltransferase [Planococcus maritimus]